MVISTKPYKQRERTSSMEQQLIAIFCDVDDFCKAYGEYSRKYLLPEENAKPFPKCSMSASEIMTIVIFFHLSNHRTFKWYYKKLICGHLKPYFPKTLSYNRFVEVMQGLIVPLTLYLMKYHFGKCSGINFLDSTTLDVCHNSRIYSHKVFRNFAKRGKSSTGWFYGFKLHLIVNDQGEILSFCLTAGNRAIIESINDFLKNICQIEHTRHRSVANLLVNLVSGLVAYSLLPKKPSIATAFSGLAICD